MSAFPTAVPQHDRDVAALALDHYAEVIQVMSRNFRDDGCLDIAHGLLLAAEHAHETAASLRRGESPPRALSLVEQ